MLKMQKLFQRSKHKRSAPGRGAAAAAATALVSSVADYSQFAAAVAQKKMVLQHAQPQNLRSKYLERVNRRRSSAVGDTGTSMGLGMPMPAGTADDDGNGTFTGSNACGGAGGPAVAPLVQQLRAYYIAPTSPPAESPPPPSPSSSPPTTAACAASTTKAALCKTVEGTGEDAEGSSRRDAPDAKLAANLAADANADVDKAADADTDADAAAGGGGGTGSGARGEGGSGGPKTSLKAVATAALVTAHRPNEMYSDINLLRRESLKFDPRIVELMHELWSVSDFDGDNVITPREYFAVFVRVHSALAYETCAEIRAFYTATPRTYGGIGIGNGGGNSSCAGGGAGAGSAVEHSETTCARDGGDADFFPPQLEHETRDMLRENFASDSDGSATLNRTLFTTAFFQLADKWTEHIDLHDYRAFLRDILDCISVCKSQRGAATAAAAAAAAGEAHDHACVLTHSHSASATLLPRGRRERVLRDHADVIALAELRRRRGAIDSAANDDSDSSTSTVVLADDDDDLNDEGSHVGDTKDGDAGAGPPGKSVSSSAGRKRSGHAAGKRDDKAKKKLWRCGPGMHVKHAPPKRYCTNSRLARLAAPRPHTSKREPDATPSANLTKAPGSSAGGRHATRDSCAAHGDAEDEPRQCGPVREPRTRCGTAGAASVGSGLSSGGEARRLRGSVAGSGGSAAAAAAGAAGAADSTPCAGSGNGTSGSAAAAAGRACLAPRSGQVHGAYARSRPKRLPPLPALAGRDRGQKQQPLSSQQQQGNNTVFTRMGTSAQAFQRHRCSDAGAVPSAGDEKEVGIKSSAEQQLDAAAWMGGRGGVRMAGLESGFVMRSGTAAGTRPGGAGAGPGAGAGSGAGARAGARARSRARSIQPGGARQTSMVARPRTSAGAGAEPRQQRQRQLQRRGRGAEHRATAVVVRSGARGDRTITQI